MILKLIVKLPTFSIFFEDRTNLAVFSESVCNSINVCRDSYFNITHGFWENSNARVCGLKLLIPTSIHNTHKHKHTYTKTPILHMFVSLYVTNPFKETKELTQPLYTCLWIAMYLHPKSAVSVLVNYSLLSTQFACCAPSVIKHVYNGTSMWAKYCCSNVRLSCK